MLWRQVRVPVSDFYDHIAKGRNIITKVPSLLKVKGKIECYAYSVVQLFMHFYRADILPDVPYMYPTKTNRHSRINVSAWNVW